MKKGEALAPLAAAVRPIVHKRATTDPQGRQVCLLVGYAPDGRPSPALTQIATAFATAGVDVHVCLAVDDAHAPVDVESLDMASAVYARRNGGYDFAIWASVLADQPALWTAARLYFANDSVLLARPDAFPILLRNIEANPSDLIWLTESNYPKHHAQSYFFVIQGKGLRDVALREFWSEIRSASKKATIIEKYELPLYALAAETGELKRSVVFSFETLFPGANLAKQIRGNPTHVLWDMLLERGSPFVKAELLHSNPLGLHIDHWRPLLQSYGADLSLIDRHLSELSRFSRSARLALSKRWLRRALGSARFEKLRAWNRVRLRRRKARKSLIRAD